MNDPKTPRNWLLARHAPAQPQLDALRRAALPASAEDITWREFLARLFRPHRVVWQALAAVWIALVAFQLSQPSTSHRATQPAVSAEAIAAWLRQSKTHEALAQISLHP